MELFIDLTNTNRYYLSESEIRKTSPKGEEMKYVTIFTRGHEIPDGGVVKKF
jgi:hypothetical protein